MKRRCAKIAIWFSGLLVAYAATYGVSLMTGASDFKGLTAGRDPAFAFRNREQMTDGGTIVYQGLGYRVLRLHRLKGSSELEVGPCLQYQLRWLYPASIDARRNLSQTKIVSR